MNDWIHNETPYRNGRHTLVHYHSDFFLMHSIPGSPFNEERNTSEAVQRNLEKFYHLDEPLYVQYGMYLKSVVTFDFGPSIKKSSQTVNEMLGRGFPVSFELGIVTLIVAVFRELLSES